MTAGLSTRPLVMQFFNSTTRTFFVAHKPGAIDYSAHDVKREDQGEYDKNFVHQLKRLKANQAAR
jgi:hypothetical protein